MIGIGWDIKNYYHNKHVLHVLFFFLPTDLMPATSSSTSASHLSWRSESWSLVMWCQPTAHRTSDPVVTEDSAGVSMATEVWSHNDPQSRSLLKVGLLIQGRTGTVCVCVISYYGDRVRSVSKALQKHRGHAAESTFKQLLRNSTMVNLFKKNIHLLSWLHFWEQMRNIFLCGVFLCLDYGSKDRGRLKWSTLWSTLRQMGQYK